MSCRPMFRQSSQFLPPESVKFVWCWFCASNNAPSFSNDKGGRTGGFEGWIIRLVQDDDFVIVGGFFGLLGPSDGGGGSG